MDKIVDFFKSITQKKELQIAIVLAIIGGILTTVAFVMAFTTANVQYATKTVPVEGFITDTRVPLAPPEFQEADGMVRYHVPWFSQKIFYFHVPIAQLSLVVFSLAAIFAGIFLKTRDPNWDLRSRIGMEVTLLFTLGAMISGSMWTRASWIDSWGELFPMLLSEPRLVTYSVMLMFVVAYFVLRRSVDGDEKKATYSAVFALLAWIIVPFSFIFTRMTNQVQAHPTDALNTGMDSTNLIPFIICIFGMMMVGYAINILRVAEEKKRAQLEAIKEDIEDALADAKKESDHSFTNQYSAAAVLGTAEGADQGDDSSDAADTNTNKGEEG